MIPLIYFFVAIVILASIAASLSNLVRRKVRAFDVFQIVGSWTFFTNEPEALFSEIIVRNAGACGETVSLLGKADIRSLVPLLDPWRRYWKIISDHTLLSRCEDVEGGAYHQAFQQLSSVIAGFSQDDSQAEIIEIVMAQS